jgi:hypothetical protein
MLPQSWYDFSIAAPEDPRDLISNVALNGVEGDFLYSQTFSHPSGSWIATPLTLNGTPICFSLWTDNQLAVAHAAQWNFLHGTISTDPKISPLLNNVIYVKAGNAWQMTIPISTNGITLTDIQLSFRDNAATSGDYIGATSGGIPAFSFPGMFSGSLTLDITFSSTGRVQLALRTIDNSGNYSMFGFECVIVD